MSVADLERISYPPLPLLPSVGWCRRAHLALIARWRAGELDRQLAEGVSPSASALLAIRCRRLTSRRYRARIATGLARRVRDAEATTRGLTAAIRPDWREVVAARTVLATLDRRLRTPEPVSAQGMAMLGSLLTDGASPFYLPTEPGELGSRLRAAAAALEPLARHHQVAVGQEVAR
jgi:hypothetical protein